MCGLMNVMSGLLFITLSIPLVLRKVGMNNLYGFRFKASFRSEENWYMINAYGGRQLITWSIAMILVGAGCFFLPVKVFSNRVLTLFLGVGPFVIFTLISSVRTMLFARRL